MATDAAVTASPRRRLLQIVARKSTVGAGDLYDLLADPIGVAAWWQPAESALADIPHAVVGGVAANAYMPESATNDLDLAVEYDGWPQAQLTLIARGWRVTELPLRRSPLIAEAWRTHDGHPVILLVVPRALRALVTTAQRNQHGGMPLATLPWLVVLKLHSQRIADTSDLGRMLGHQPPTELARVRRLVRSRTAHRFGLTDADSEDLEQIITLGRLEYGPERPRRRRLRPSW